MDRRCCHAEYFRFIKPLIDGIVIDAMIKLNHNQVEGMSLAGMMAFIKDHQVYLYNACVSSIHSDVWKSQIHTRSSVKKPLRRLSRNIWAVSTHMSLLSQISAHVSAFQASTFISPHSSFTLASQLARITPACWNTKCTRSTRKNVTLRYNANRMMSMPW